MIQNNIQISIKFLVGISLDGPPNLHDKYRFDKQGRPSHQQVVDGIRCLQAHQVDYNILCVVNECNAQKPVEVYNYIKSLDVEYMQFIPIVEHFGDGDQVSPRSVGAKQYGQFLSAIFAISGLFFLSLSPPQPKIKEILF